MKIRFFAGVFLCVALCMPGSVSGDTASAGENIVARVNGVPITEQEVQGVIDIYLPTAFYHGTITPEKRAEFRPRAIEDLIKKQLYLEESRRMGYTITKPVLADAVKKLKARFRSEDEFLKALKAYGYTTESYEKTVEENMLVNRFVEEEITKKSQVTEEELKEYYEKNKEDFIMPEAYSVRHILIKVGATATPEEKEEAKKHAEEVLARAKAGEDFADLAAENSMDEWRIKGGDLGIVHKGRLEPALDKVITTLEVGQISDLTETIYGYHILKLDGKTPPKQVSFDEIKTKLRKQTEESRRKEREENILKRLKENAKIEIYDAEKK